MPEHPKPSDALDHIDHPDHPDRPDQSNHPDEAAMRAALDGMCWRREALTFTWPRIGREAALTAFRANLPEITAAALRLFEDLPVTADEARAVRDGEALSGIHHLDGVGRLQVRNFLDAAEGLLGMDAFRFFTARSQFFFDANKRTGLLAMEGVLLAAGFPPLILPADEAGARNPEGVTGFYARLRDFYRTGDAAPMMRFFAKRVRAVTGHRAKA